MVDWGSALLVAVLGLSIVFIVLALIMLVLIVMEKIFAPKKKEAPSVKQEVKKEEPKKPVEVKKNDDAELIAVLTAAVAACLNANTPSGGISTKFKIKSYRKLGDTSSAWNNASRKENIYSRF